MYKTALKKSVLLISLALSAAAPAVDLSQHLSFDYRTPGGNGIGDLRTALTANACHSLTDPMVIRLSLADIDWKQYDVNLKINGRDINAAMASFKENTDLVKPFLVSADNKLTDQMVTADQTASHKWVLIRATEPYCLGDRSDDGGTNATDVGSPYHGTGGFPVFHAPKPGEKGSRGWNKCSARVMTANEDDNWQYPEAPSVGTYNIPNDRRPLIYDHSKYLAELDERQYQDHDHFMLSKLRLQQLLELLQGVSYGSSSKDQVADRFWHKYMFYQHAQWGWSDTTQSTDGKTTLREPTSLLGLTLIEKNRIDADKALKPSVDYTPSLYAPGSGSYWSTFNGDPVVKHYLAGNVTYYTSQRNIQSIELTVTRKDTVPVIHSFKWSRAGTGNTQKNVLLPNHTGDLVKPSAEQYAADYYQKQGFYATTPDFYRGTLVASAGLNTKYTDNPAPLSRPAGMNGSINLVNTNDLTLRLTSNKITGEINALFYGQPLQFADLKLGEQKIMAKKIRDVCY